MYGWPEPQRLPLAARGEPMLADLAPRLRAAAAAVGRAP
jgi:hypothetical protein